MQYLPAGDLYTYLMDNAPFPEDDCRQIISQLLRALSVMHAEGFAHRDIKPQNVLIHQSPAMEPFGPWWVKLADFGISKRFRGDVVRNSTVFGTEEYMAPELFKQHELSYIDHQAIDVWALGVMAFLLLTKTPLFHSRQFAFQYEADPERLFPCHSLDACNVSIDGQAFIRSLIRPDPEERPECREAMGDPWVAFWIPDAPMIPDNLSNSLSLLSIRSSLDAGFPSNPSVDTASAMWSDEITNMNQGNLDEDSEGRRLPIPDSTPTSNGIPPFLPPIPDLRKIPSDTVLSTNTSPAQVISLAHKAMRYALDQSEAGITVDLSRKHIQLLPEEVVDIIKNRVERLALSHNQLSMLPINFSQCSTLRYLNIRANRLEEFPLPICDIESLEILDIGRNQLQLLPPDIIRLSSLKVLAFPNNRIQELPLCLADMSALQVILFKKNPIRFPPQDAILAKIASLPKENTSQDSDVAITAHIKRLLRQHMIHEELDTEK